MLTVPVVVMVGVGVFGSVRVTVSVPVHSPRVKDFVVVLDICADTVHVVVLSGD